MSKKFGSARRAATLGLPPVSVTQNHIQARLDKLFGAEHGYAEMVPAMQKVVQAAGRVLHTPKDRGWLWLLDERYRRADVSALMPAWWGWVQPLDAGAASDGQRRKLKFRIGLDESQARLEA